MRQGVDLILSGIGTDLAAVDAAIEDPASDIELIGIPLRPDEVKILTSSGMYLNEEAPIAFWTYDGRPDLFGAHWIDPPGSHRHVVSIVDGDEDTLKLARCLERDGLDIRYVTALRSRAELLALAERVVGDWDALRDEGIEIVSAGQRSSANTVSIGVEGLTDEISATLRERYGQHVIVKEDSLGQLDGG